VKYIPSKIFFAEPRWKALRQRALQYWGRKCMKGGNCAGPIQVDHVLSRSTRPDLQWSFNNLQPLCYRHNHEKGRKGKRDYRPLLKRWKFRLLGY
jgi:5-methylcytosine-specific restriction endonuclease McrA